MVVVQLPRAFNCSQTLVIPEHVSLDDLNEIIVQLTRSQVTDFYLVHNDRKITSDDQLEGVIHVVPRLPGGKGGFGSMLRAIGAQIEKTTNREACRDLSGRRLRDINEERRLKNWLAQKEDREREAKERKRKRIERMMQEPKVEIKDEDYNLQRSNLTENISDSVELGLKVAESSGVKRKPEEILTSVKKPKKGLLFNLDIDIDSDAEISSSDDEEPSTSAASSGTAGATDNSEPGTSGVKSKISSGDSSASEVEDDQNEPIAGTSSVAISNT